MEIVYETWYFPEYTHFIPPGVNASCTNLTLDEETRDIKVTGIPEENARLKSKISQKNSVHLKVLHAIG